MGRWLRAGWLAVILGVAWLVPVALHALRIDVLQPFLLLVAVASVLRSGTNLVDRLMLAAGLLAGTALSFGLVFSIWPWGLQPVPVGGTLFSLVAAAAWATRRRPNLPRRMLGSDVLVLGSGIFAFLAAYAPIARLSAANRLRFSTMRTDRFNHFALFDTIHRLGGYAFLHQARAQFSVQGNTPLVYPSGSHFLFALFDTFLRSSAGPGPPLAEFNRYFIYVLAAFAFLIMTLVWAARWIAGPMLAGWPRFAICSGVAALALGGPLVVMTEYGLDSEITGLAFLALAVAVTVRPPRVVREQVLIACALFVGVAYTYNLYISIAALGMVAAGIVYRRRLRRHWRFTVLTVVAGGAIALYPSVLSLASGFNAQGLTLASLGSVVPLPAPLVAGLALVLIAAMARTRSRRLPAWRAMVAQLVVAAIVISAFAGYQLIEMGRTSYYFNKLLVAGYVVCLAGFGALGGFRRPSRARLGRPVRPARPVTRAAWARRLRAACLAVVAGAVAMGLATLIQSGLSSRQPRVWAQSQLSNWSTGKVTSPTGPSLTSLARARLLGDGVPSLVLAGSKMIDFADSYLAAVLNRDGGAMTGQINAIIHALSYRPQAGVNVGRQEFRAAKLAIGASPFPLRFIVRDPVLAARLRAMLAARHDIRATVIVLRTL